MSVNLNNTTPAAAAGGTNVLWQVDGSGNISAYTLTAASVTTEVDLTAQTANISATTLVTPGSAGFYRVSVYSIVTTVDGASSTLPKTTITWTDAHNTTAQTFDVTPTNAGNVLTTFQQGSMRLNSVSGTAIKYATSGYASGTPATMQYALRITLEKI
jgi:hypothetical protein